MGTDTRTGASRLTDERGAALVMTVFFAFLLLTLATMLLGSATTETQIGTNHLAQLQAFYSAEAGVARAKEWLDANKTNAPLMDALLAEAQTANPDQSSLTLADATVVATPLGTQPFANGTYSVVIRDNADDADFLTDSDRRWILASQGDGLANASRLMEVEVMGSPPLSPPAAVSTRGGDINVDFDQSGGGTGSRIPPAPFDGNAYDLNGNLLPAGGSCASVPPISTDSALATLRLMDEFDDLRSNIVKRANGERDQFGAPACPPGTTGCCTPGLWWVRGSAATPRFDRNDPASYNQLDLSTPELHAIGADYVTITQPPTMVLAAPETAPFDGAVGNTAEPFVSQVATQEMLDQLNALQDVIDSYSSADTVDVTSGTFTNGSVNVYGSATAPKLVTASNNLRIRNGTTFTGFGILVVDRLLDIRDSSFTWTGVVLLQGNQPELQTRSSVGQFNGAVFFNATTGKPKFDMDKNSDNLGIRYSCDAIALAASVAPTQTLSWIELHR